MFAQLRFSLTYANVMATVAVFVALGGTSYAVATGSIDSREIKNNTVRSKDIRNNDVRSRDVRDGALLARDFKPGQLPAGPKGDKGDTGAPGAPGAPGLSGYQRVDASSTSDTSTPKEVDAVCPAGKTAIGGGYSIEEQGLSENGSVAVTHDRALLGAVAGTGWKVRAVNSESELWQLFVFAYCVTIAP